MSPRVPRPIPPAPLDAGNAAYLEQLYESWLADRAAAVTVDLVVTSDARVVHGRFSELVVFRARTEAVTTREASVRTRAPVLVLADASWRDLRLGSALRVSGRLQPADDPDLATLFVRLIREGTVIWTGKVGSLRRFKDDVQEVEEGQECGIVLDGYADVKEADVLEFFQTKQVEQTLE